MCIVLDRADSQWSTREIRELSIHFKALQRASKGNRKSQPFQKQRDKQEMQSFNSQGLGHMKVTGTICKMHSNSSEK